MQDRVDIDVDIFLQSGDAAVMYVSNVCMYKTYAERNFLQFLRGKKCILGKAFDDSVRHYGIGTSTDITVTEMFSQSN